MDIARLDTGEWTKMLAPCTHRKLQFSCKSTRQFQDVIHNSCLEAIGILCRVHTFAGDAKKLPKSVAWIHLVAADSADAEINYAIEIWV